jgi:hypothetical protein
MSISAEQTISQADMVAASAERALGKVQTVAAVAEELLVKTSGKFRNLQRLPMVRLQN